MIATCRFARTGGHRIRLIVYSDPQHKSQKPGRPPGSPVQYYGFAGAFGYCTGDPGGRPGYLPCKMGEKSLSLEPVVLDQPTNEIETVLLGNHFAIFDLLADVVLHIDKPRGILFRESQREQ